MIFRHAQFFWPSWLGNGARFLAAIAVFTLLSGCADGQAVIMGPQQWQDLEFRVEVRPSPPVVGMNEFIVIASREVYKPGVGLVINIRVGEQAEWRQAIQDGFTGVYRRAVRVDDPLTQSLSVQVIRAETKEETMLSFPLSQKALPKADS
ncbi:MAG: hypothetical protein RRB22_06410 [Gammaproteobacteria bacterium]|nr:hypothetical protein [Gammaproteobacteria bacterium]